MSSLKYFWGFVIICTLSDSYFCTVTLHGKGRSGERNISSELIKEWDAIAEFCDNSNMTNLTVNQTYTRQVVVGSHCLMTFTNFESATVNTRFRLEVSLSVPIPRLSFVADPLLVAVLHSYDLNEITLPMVVESESNVSRELLSASRLLCLEYDENGLHKPTDVDLLVHTDNDFPLPFDVKLVGFDVQKMSLGSSIDLTITQNSPIYLQFDFDSAEEELGEKLTNVLIRLDSDSGSCMTLSIQRPQCPNYDRESNVKFEGIWQTVSTVGAINVNRYHKEFEHGFYIVLVLHSNFHQCYTDTVDEDGVNRMQDVEKNVTVRLFQDYAGAGHYWGQILIPIVIAAVCCIVPISCIVFRKFWNNGESYYENILTDTLKRRIKIVQQEALNSVEGNNNEESVVDPDNPEERYVATVEGEEKLNRGKFGGIVVSDLCSDRDDNGSQSSYPCLLFTMSLFFTVPVLQLLRNNVQIFWNSGNFDFCYYNFLCSHPIKFPLFNLYDGNHVLSNIPYIFFGLSFYAIALRKKRIMTRLEKKQRMLNPGSPPTGLPLQYNGIYQAMGLALAMEGILSASYHICPTEVNFQFDTVYMYVISFLGIVKVMQSRHAVHPGSHTTFTLVASFAVISVLGVIADSSDNDPLRLTFYLLFFILHLGLVLLSLFIMYFIGFRVTVPEQDLASVEKETYKKIASVRQTRRGTSRRHGHPPERKPFKETYVLILFQRIQLGRIFRILIEELRLFRANNNRSVIIWSRFWRTICLFVPNLVLMYFYLSDMNGFPSHLLNILLANFGVLLFWYIVCKLFEKRWSWKNLFFWQSTAYLLFFLVLFGIAYLMFFIQFLTEWEMTAALSRARNAECYSFDFYDSHDLWHFLSGCALFSGFMFLLTLDDDLVGVPRDEIHIF